MLHPAFPRRPAHRRLIAPFLAALLAIQLLPVSATRAADDSNIPGIPLPSRTVVGQLGGPIYDHVFQFDVPANSVILISLTGDPGTDFDLYLFDSSASTIYGIDGLVASSTSDDSTESITHPTPGGGRYYVDLNGATDVQGAFRLTVAIQRDSQPPKVRVDLEGGQVATSTETVTVAVIATDDLSGAQDMQLSTDGVAFRAWEPYAPTFLWTFPSGDGPKRLWARVRDRAGNVSTVADDTIVLDTRQPSVALRSPGPDERLIGLTGTFEVRFDEPIDPATWGDDGLIVQRLDGSNVAGTLAWNDALNAGTFIPSAGVGLGERLVVNIGTVADLAGNPAVPVGPWSVVAVLVQQMAIQSVPSVITSGETARLTGVVDQPGLSALTLESLVRGGPWTTVGPLSADALGAFSVAVGPTRNTFYRIHSAGSAVIAESNSGTTRVVVRRALSLTGPAPTTTRTARVGRTTTLTVRIGPADPAVIVTLTVRRYDAARRAFVTAATLRATSIAGRATFGWRPTTSGMYTLRLTTSTAPDFAAGISPTYVARVT